MVLEAEGAAAHPAQGERAGRRRTWPGRARRATAPRAGVYETIEVKVPDIGDFKDVPVIEVLVSEGDEVAAEDPLMTLESDKATMDVPSPAAGTVAAVKVKVGDRVSAGHAIMTCGPVRPPAAAEQAARAGTIASRPATDGRARRPPRRGAGAGRRAGGYTAAFRAADLGKQVVLVEAVADAGRRLPERRLHPVQGAAARGQGDRRDQGDGRPRPPLRRPARSTSTRCAAGRTASSSGSPAAWPGWPSSARSTVVRGTGRFTSLNQLEVDRGRRRRTRR